MPEYEERQAARWGNYNWSEWCGLSRDERIVGVAHYRMANLVEVHIQEAGDRERRLRGASAAANRAGRGRGGRQR